MKETITKAAWLAAEQCLGRLAGNGAPLPATHFRTAIESLVAEVELQSEMDS
ncbi:MAG TPA: hypothetical protein VKG65_07340 [Terriglobales bacterium]|nr:hypothetical protein [Terriglobales bacterium]